jgi:hypothetical protein
MNKKKDITDFSARRRIRQKMFEDLELEIARIERNNDIIFGVTMGLISILAIIVCFTTIILAIKGC